MQDEINEKVIALAVNLGKTGARMTTELLQKTLQQFLRDQQLAKSSRNGRDKPVKHGKQSFKKLSGKDLQLTNIEITDQNIKSFEKVAKKYNIDFALKKDMSADPPRYLVFFKARDVDVMNAAFKEYTAKSLQKNKKPSIIQKLEKMQEQTKKLNKVLEKVKQKFRGQKL